MPKVLVLASTKMREHVPELLRAGLVLGCALALISACTPLPGPL